MHIPDHWMMSVTDKYAINQVLIDGKDLRDYNLTCLRNYMGIVSQEPVLFSSTIGENIKMGAKYGDDVTQQQIEMVAREANCYDFITKLPKVRPVYNDEYSPAII